MLFSLFSWFAIYDIKKYELKQNLKNNHIGVLNRNGFSGFKGSKELYALGRVNDALLLIGKEFDSISIPEKMLKLELEILGKNNLITYDCRALDSGFLIDSQNKILYFYKIENDNRLLKWPVIFNDVLGISIVKNETQILQTKKNNTLGNALLEA